MKNFNNYGGSLECPIFRGFTENKYIGGNCLKKGELEFKRGLGKKEGLVFLRQGDTPMQCMYLKALVKV